MADKFFWADAIADRIIKERKKSKNKEYVCASGITPSGVVHIGNFREIITTEMVVRALRDKGKKVRFIYSWDDYDRFRKIPKGVDAKYEKYIGMPISDIPSPFNPKLSYAGYNEKNFEKSLPVMGIKPEFIYQNKMNKKCAYAGLIKKALDNKEEIMKILNKYRKEPLNKNWWPIMIYCSKCKKDTTKIISQKGYEIEYSCDSCGFKERFDFRKKGIVSIRWRVDWPLRWKYEKVDFEPSGIDHQVSGGSFMTGKEIVKKIFGYEGPAGLMYEWVTVKGIRLKEFHSSVGNVVTLDEVLEIYEPEVLRYIFVSTRPNKSFEIGFDANVIKIYDEYDMLEEKYYSKTASPQEKRIYEMSQVSSEIKKERPEKLGFKHLVNLIQVGKTKGISKESKSRERNARNWIVKYAPEDFKFEIREKPKFNSSEFEFSDKQKQALNALKESLSVKNMNETELFNEFYSICNAVNIQPKEFFEAAYTLLIGKTRGPRLAPLILSVGKEKVIKILGQV